MNNIVIWNDLYLYGLGTDDLQIQEICNDYCEYTLIDQNMTEQWITKVRKSCDGGIAVGTRPGWMFGEELKISTTRNKDETGHTLSSRCTIFDLQSFMEYLDHETTIVVLEDAIVDGVTMDSVLSRIREFSNKTIEIYCLIVSEYAADKLIRKHQNVKIHGEYQLTGKPIEDTTALFISDLLTVVDGKMFIDNEALMRPCFHYKYEEFAEQIHGISSSLRSLKIVSLDMECPLAGMFYLLKMLVIGLSKISTYEIPQIHFGKNEWYKIENRDLFDVFFEQDRRLTFLDSEYPSRKLDCKDCDIQLEYGDYNQFSKENVVLANVWKKYIRTKANLIHRLERDVLNRFSGKRVLGCHMRIGFSKRFYGHPNSITIEQYIDSINKELSSNRYDAVFIAADDEACISAVNERIETEKIYFKCTRSLDQEQPIEYYLKEKDGMETAYECLRDMYALSQCTSLICGRSNMSYCALLMRLSNDKTYDKINLLDNGICYGGIRWEEYVTNNWNKNNRKELYVCDIDNTLTENGAIKEQDCQRINKLICNNVPITFATARSRGGLLRVMDGVIILLPSIHYNGACIWDNLRNTILKYYPFSRAEKKRNFDRLLEEKRAFFVVYVDGAADYAAYTELEAVTSVTAHLGSIEKKHMPKNVTKDEMLELEWIAIYEWNEVGGFVETVAQGVNKGIAAQYVAWQFEFESIVAFGDDYNDYDLFKLSEYPYCKKNSCRLFNDLEFQGYFDRPAQVLDIIERRYNN